MPRLKKDGTPKIAPISESELPRLVAADEFLPQLGMTRSMMDRLIHEGRFPRPVKLGDEHCRSSTRRWKLADIQKWLESREAVSK